MRGEGSEDRSRDGGPALYRPHTRELSIPPSAGRGYKPRPLNVSQPAEHRTEMSPRSPASPHRWAEKGTC